MNVACPMKARIASVFLLSTAVMMPAAGQLAAPNAAGVSVGHMHLYVSDTAAQQKFWTLLGGVPVANQRLQMIQFPGVMILYRKAQINGGTAGSIVNHLGFAFKDLPAEMAKWKAAGYQIEPDQNSNAQDPNHGFLLGPDGIRIEFYGDPSLKVPIAMNHIHLYPQDVAAMQAWYVKIFGGAPSKQAVGGSPELVDCVDIPGAILAMSKSETKLDPTSGRSLDHIGFEVKDLPEFLKQAEAQGATITQKLTPSNFSSKMRVAFITDPWGTKIEVTEGLAP
jgi:catechol 2,3-dioxygenase-like lactoylglutathione lyase family enzyme